MSGEIAVGLRHQFFVVTLCLYSCLCCFLLQLLMLMSPPGTLCCSVHSRSLSPAADLLWWVLLWWVLLVQASMAYEAAVEAGIPSHLVTGRDLWKRPEVKTVLALLHCVLQPHSAGNVIRRRLAKKDPKIKCSVLDGLGELRHWAAPGGICPGT